MDNHPSDKLNALIEHRKVREHRSLAWIAEVPKSLGDLVTAV